MFHQFTCWGESAPLHIPGPTIPEVSGFSVQVSALVFLSPDTKTLSLVLGILYVAGKLWHSIGRGVSYKAKVIFQHCFIINKI
jgi:hypothetical protein